MIKITLILIVILCIIGLMAAIAFMSFKFFKSFIKEVLMGILGVIMLIIGWHLLWKNANVGDNKVYLDYIQSGHAIQKDISDTTYITRQLDHNRVHTKP